MILNAPARMSDHDIGEKLLRDYVFVHLSRPADKLAFLLQMLHKLYALVSGQQAPDWHADVGTGSKHGTSKHHPLLLGTSCYTHIEVIGCIPPFSVTDSTYRLMNLQVCTKR